MTTESMTIHQALVELKTLEKRITTEIRSVVYVVANKHGNTKIEGIPVKEYSQTVTSHYQKVRDLMRRREAIKRAVVLTNAQTTVAVAGKTYTVAEAIEMKNHGLEGLNLLLMRLTNDYTTAKRTADNANGDTLERRADDHIKNLFGNSDMKGASEEVRNAREEFIKNQTMELVDPIGIQKEMEKLSEEIVNFQMEVDSALSVSNALTTITIEY
jgi:hypothetical protein